ncbi:hypothetical protein [Mitsuokella sp.]|uniref:hypothetical protein n=1 Tax=Mitsuokella sp. TaxID=2049034 RepID=UPI003D7D9595
MRRLCLLLVTFLIGCTFLLSNLSVAGATDVWVDHWNSENIDVYVIDDTLSHGYTSNGRWFSVSTKFVQDGQLQQVVKWNFSKYGRSMWRYYTNTMSQDHDTVVIPHNGVFEYGMDQLGWSYSIRDIWYY